MKLSAEYIAGLFDGEGSVSLIKRSSKSAVLGGQPVESYYPALSLTQNNSEILHGVVETIGCGSVNRSHSRGNYETWAATWHYQNAVNAANFLLPHVILKRRQLELITEFHGRYANYTKGFARYASTNPEYERRLLEQTIAARKCRSNLKEARHVTYSA